MIILPKIKKACNALLIITSLVGYLQWGKDQSIFLLQAEFEIMQKGLHNPFAVAHPFILLPFIGQLLLLITLFQGNVNKQLTIIGWISLSTIVLMILLVGLLSVNVKILISVLPYLVTSLFMIKSKIVNRT